MEFTVRRATLADFPHLRSDMPWCDRSITANDRMRAWFDRAFVWVACDPEGRVIGNVFASIYRPASGDLNLWLFFLNVDESCRGQRIGTFLMLEVESLAVKIGAHGVTLSVDDLNISARSWYERSGYVAFDTRESDIDCSLPDGTPDQVHVYETLMRKVIERPRAETHWRFPASGIIHSEAATIDA